MSRKQTFKKMREVLVQRREALRQAINGDNSLLKKLEQQAGGDVVDFALETAYGELSSQLAEVETRELASIDNALRLMDEGQYGVCEACKSSIPLARLQALPYATSCIECQRLAEEHGHRPGDRVDWSQILDIPTETLGDMDFNVS